MAIDVIDRLALLRESANMTIADFAVITGASPNQVKNALSRKQRPPTELLEGACRRWPHLCQWLMTGRCGSEQKSLEAVRRQLDDLRRVAEPASQYEP
jgi:transcriptional regulator with XRE-family HTH domain